MASWKDALGVAAPAIATALGGPLAGVAASSLCKFFGIDSSSSEEDLAKAVQTMSPDQIVELKKVDADFRTKMTQANVDLERIAADDRISARDMAKTTGGNTQVILTIVTAAMFIGCLVALFFGRMEDLGADTKTILNYAVGQISGWFGSAVIFYFGSSAGSRDKDEAIKRLSQE